MGLLYRQDIFDQYEITPPTTWDEYAAAAQTLHDADPDVYITNLPPADPGVWMGLLWQAGAKPFEMNSPTDITIRVTDDISKQVAEYWQGLIQADLVSTDTQWSDEWFQALANGKYASWVTAAWGPVFLQGAAEGTSGLWRASRLPQWAADQDVSGNWGGSTTAVIEGTQNPIAAAKFAEFLNTDPETTKLFTTEQFFFPATKALLSDPSFVGQEPEFYGGQQVNQLFAEISDTVDLTFQWAPFLDQAYTDFTETVGKAMTDKGDMVAALDAWQQRLTDYATSQGFSVSE